jgi:hypothetical protein
MIRGTNLVLDNRDSMYVPKDGDYKIAYVPTLIWIAFCVSILLLWVCDKDLTRALSGQQIASKDTLLVLRPAASGRAPVIT